MRVGEVVVEFLRPIQERYHYLMQDSTELDRVLAKGAEQAAAVSQPKVDQMKEIMGLVLPISKGIRTMS
jgi:tryptophanyl-tRNA synthetase